MSHTPGPWKALFGRQDGAAEIHADSENLPIAGVRKPDDARLIAAAPDLLEALEALADAKYRDESYEGEWPDWESSPELAKARAAITKAKGGESRAL